MSVTRMSNDAADCLSQTPRAERSAISAGVPFSTSDSFTTGSLFTSFHKIEARLPTASLISLCRSVTSPPSCKKVHAVSQNLVDIHRISRKNV